METQRNRWSKGALSLAGAVALIGAGLIWQGAPILAAERATMIPPPVLDAMAESDGQLATAVLAGGCFWGVQAVFQHTEGIENAVSGYAGGDPANPSYRQVTTGTTGHAESVQITYDPNKISYGKILQIFFSVAHDPTQLNRQGPDVGTQYRSAIFAMNDAQQKIAEAYVDQLGGANVYTGEIVTEISPLKAFYAAEDYHQDYATLHPNQPYIVWNDRPKVDNLKAMFPDLWRDEPKLVFASSGS